MSQKPKPKNFGLADYKKFHVGYSFGLGAAGFTINENDGYKANLKQDPLININLIADYRIGKYLNIRALPGFRAASRKVWIHDPKSPYPIGVSRPDTLWSIESTYLELPVLLKYSSSRVNNVAPYLIAGFSPQFDFSGKPVDFTHVSSITTNPLLLRILKNFDLQIELGTGIDFYLSTTKVAAEIKFCVGLLNIFHEPLDVPPADIDNYSLYIAGIDQIFSRMVILSFHVEQSK